MRHAVSPNQLILWPHHALNPAWAPAGVVKPPHQDDATRPEDHSAGAGQDEANRGPAPAPERPAISALTCAGGVCAQARHGRRASKAARAARRAARLTDLA